MSKLERDFKSLLYYYIRRGWNDQLIDACDKKGKDSHGITMFWKAYALGASGNIPECLRQLAYFDNKSDMQYPVSLATAYFHQKAKAVDHDALTKAKQQMSISEDLTVIVYL